jgi:hypothetical protein
MGETMIDFKSNQLRPGAADSAATIADLKSACPGMTSDWYVQQMESGATLDAARQAALAQKWAALPPAVREEEWGGSFDAFAGFTRGMAAGAFGPTTAKSSGAIASERAGGDMVTEEDARRAWDHLPAAEREDEWAGSFDAFYGFVRGQAAGHIRASA